LLNLGTVTSYIAFAELKATNPIENLREVGLVLDEHAHLRRGYQWDGNGMD
jgi:hypothetical protein